MTALEINKETFIEWYATDCDDTVEASKYLFWLDPSGALFKEASEAYNRYRDWLEEEALVAQSEEYYRRAYMEMNDDEREI